MFGCMLPNVGLVGVWGAQELMDHLVTPLVLAHYYLQPPNMFYFCKLRNIDEVILPSFRSALYLISLSPSPSSSWQGCVAIVDIIHGLVCLSLPYMLFSTLSWPISPPLFLFQLMLYFLHCNIANGKGFNIYEEPENFFLELWCVKWEGGDLWEI